MATERFARRMIDLHKSNLDMMLSTMSSLQEQSGRATQAFYEQLANLPRQGVSEMNRWMASVRKTRSEFISMVLNVYNAWENAVEQTPRMTQPAMRPAAKDQSTSLPEEKPKPEKSPQTAQTPAPVQATAEKPPQEVHPSQTAGDVESTAKPGLEPQAVQKSKPSRRAPSKSARRSKQSQKPE